MPEQPLVSCLMPTHDRRRFVPLAVAYWLRQSYPNRELVVLDDGREPVGDLLPPDPRIRYEWTDKKLAVGEKRNRLAELARGELLAHWDDDDWSGPARLAEQVAALDASGADLVGLDRPLFWDPEAERAWEYWYAGRRPWAAGGTWLYRKSLWAERPFDAVDDGEDTRFVWRLPPARVHPMGDADWFVALVHPSSSSRKSLRAPRWRPVPEARVAERLGSDLARYGDAPVTAAPAPPPDEAPWVTVAVPTYGDARHLRRAVESVLGQTHANVRAVVVHDGGPPPWDALAGLEDPRLVRFSLEANRGRYFADAVVLGATPDAYFAVQDADDWSEPERIETLLRRLREDDAEVAYAASYKCVEDRPDERWVERFDDLFQPIGAAFVHRAHHPAALYCTEALRRVGGLWAGFRIGYDSLLVNLLRMTARVAFEPTPLTTYAMRTDSLTGDAATGFGSAAREEAWAALHERYQAARTLYEQHRAGTIRRDTLAALIRPLLRAGVPPADAGALDRETARLRAAMGVPAPTPPAVPALGALLADGRLPWSDWSVSRALAEALAAYLERHRPARVLEVGSGVSTLVLARYAAAHGARVTALEHDLRHWERTRDLLDAFGLADIVDLRCAPLRRTRHGHWYDATLDGPFDFVFADGPPLAVGRRALLPSVRPALAERWTLWLKDGHREHERVCVEAWAAAASFRRRLWDVDPRGVWVLAGGVPEAPALVGTAAPLVSCLMPTANRRPFVAQAVRYFLRQDYPRRELVVVDDGEDAVADLLPDDDRVTYVRLQGTATTGTKRNAAAEVARGEVLVCWDDDDWYGPARLSAQAAPLLSGTADVTAVGRSPFLALPTGRWWRCDPRVHARMFYKGVVGGTLGFRREAWRQTPFPDASLGEDAAMLRAMLRLGVRLAPVPNAGHFVYVRHAANSWRFPEGRFVDRRGWQAVAPPAFMPEADRAFYHAFRCPQPVPA